MKNKKKILNDGILEFMEVVGQRRESDTIRNTNEN